MGRAIKDMLSDNKLTNKWLINELKKYRVNTSESELSQVLSGNRLGFKADTILCTSTRILNDYERLYNSQVERN